MPCIFKLIPDDDVLAISGVHNLMETGGDISTSYVLERHACLDEETAFGDLDSLFLPVASPNLEARVPTFTAHGKEADV